ncbi:hemerythrin domain-containing protein [Mycolicibacterium mucogenicum]|jgi:hemerythrin superfamily protein|uniref:hemerythrin domain-containing protein n=1 Tax=Mycolicibacterium TaxID=1866885 RepID=UPI00226AF889|nr:MULTISPECIES: hemerythrin domain-containing protein [Mycolicibacterium]MCX8562214.1 hemerythrin domain-containing protein [Mycolicibacterium mucogenicum]
MRPASTTAHDDVIDYVKAQHLTTRELFSKTLHAADVAARREHFAELRAALTAQEVSEELLVHPKVRRGRVVESLRDETDDTKELLDHMAGLDPASAEFETALTDLRQATEDHTQRVEAEEFPLLTRR